MNIINNTRYKIPTDFIYGLINKYDYEPSKIIIEHNKDNRGFYDPNKKNKHIYPSKY